MEINNINKDKLYNYYTEKELKYIKLHINEYKKNNRWNNLVKDYKPNKKLKKALKELKDVENGKIKLKRYTNMEDFIKNINE